jgi:hypothetical protein
MCVICDQGDTKAKLGRLIFQHCFNQFGVLRQELPSLPKYVMSYKQGWRLCGVQGMTQYRKDSRYLRSAKRFLGQRKKYLRSGIIIGSA